MEEHGSARGAEDHRSSRIELVSVALIALTAVLTAWSAFQGSKWGGEMSIEFSAAGASRTESVRASNLANQQRALDVGLFTSYSGAFASDDQELRDFFLDRMPPRLAVAVRAWNETEPRENADAPPTPFDMAEYKLTALDDAAQLQREADQHSSDARDANRKSDNYTITSVFFASVILLAALSTKVGAHRLQVVLLVTAGVIFVATGVVIATFPVQT